ncbi:unknown [Staphylococcus sp. CAG:324]|nr:unknown [Staphylococcus sp. CAG:324]
MIKIYFLNMVIIFENVLLSNKVNMIERSDVK